MPYEIVVSLRFKQYSGLRVFASLGDALRFEADHYARTFPGRIAFEQIQPR